MDQHQVQHQSTNCWIKSCLLMCSGNPHRNSLQGNLQIYNQSWQKCQLNPCGSTLRTPSKSHDQLPAHPFPQQVYHQVHPAHRRATARVLVLLVMKYAALTCLLDRSQLRAFIFGANPSSQPGNLDSWMLSDFKIKLPTVGEKKPRQWKSFAVQGLEDTLLSYTGFVILLKCIWFSSQSTNRNAKTSYRKKKTHVTSLKGNNMWSLWMHQDTCLGLPAEVREMPNTLFLTCMK